ncbi:ribosomal protein S18 acetylase RimI-like enzyme [Isoptericola variabilis J7]|uniref:GCN5-related N-acetyltransferase n=1 Tax=Isoptericola variabilis (strain 225) TaxID=743718 RepID=F6FQL7_ISOV2|nr:GCN5-related N-acetyltransferase [Isoptericola variabilis 225]TWH26075.1 ribosomal protein S18 acetylase RimI-like enzyme [Isoptericola variabilis J7]
MLGRAGPAASPPARFGAVTARTDVVVRPARPEEAAEIAWLAALTFPLACPPGTPVATMAAHVADKLTPARFEAWARSDAHALVVATDEASSPAVLGYALVVLGMPDGEAEAAVLRDVVGSGPYAELSKIYVHPRAQGTGVAGALMEGAVAAAGGLAARAGHPTPRPLWLGTNGQNARAQAFYRRHGFTVVGRRTYVVGGVEHDDVVMLHAATH